jgi:hypothetical protein
VSIPTAYELAEFRSVVAEMLIDSAVIERNVVGAEPAPGYQPERAWQTVGTIPCRFPVPIAGSVLGAVTSAELDFVKRRYGMLVTLDADIGEGDQVASITDKTGRTLAGPLFVDAVSLRSSHALVILEAVS